MHASASARKDIKPRYSIALPFAAIVLGLATSLHQHWHRGCRQAADILRALISTDLRPTNRTRVFMIQPLMNTMLAKNVLTIQSDRAIVGIKAHRTG